MKIIRYGSEELRLYDCLEDMPIRVWHKFNEYMILSSAGSTIADLERNYALMVKFSLDSDKDSFAAAANNMAMNIALLKGNFHPKLFAFTVLSKDLKGLDEGSIQEHADYLFSSYPISNRKVNETIDEVIANIKSESKVLFNNVAALTHDEAFVYYQKLKIKGNYLLDFILYGTDKSDEIKRMEFEINKILKPVNTNPQDAESNFTLTKRAQAEMEVAIDREFGVDESRTLLKFYTIIAQKIQESKERENNGR